MSVIRKKLDADLLTHAEVEALLRACSRRQLRADFLKREIDSGFTLYVGDVMEALAGEPSDALVSPKWCEEQ
jgi:hypothetical protein